MEKEGQMRNVGKDKGLNKWIWLERYPASCCRVERGEIQFSDPDTFHGIFLAISLIFRAQFQRTQLINRICTINTSLWTLSKAT